MKSSSLKKMIKDSFPLAGGLKYGTEFYQAKVKIGAKEVVQTSKGKFLMNNIENLRMYSAGRVSDRISSLMSHVDIVPIKNNVFFYSIDPYKTIGTNNSVFDNYSPDYATVVNSSLGTLRKELMGQNTDFAAQQIIVIDSMQAYCHRVIRKGLGAEFQPAIEAIKSLFERPAETLFEALQRILFYNQFLWQTKHSNIGLGHLDWILEDVYKRNQLQQAHENGPVDLLRDFFRALHEFYTFKSASLIGDTGQIIVLGGLSESGEYHCNDLTYLFVRTAKELGLPDPKILLRCSKDMPQNLLGKGIECIASGIGAPLLSNDDVVIPAMMQAGYSAKSAYNYATSACWEPLVPGESCDQNNSAILNFASPLVTLLDSEEADKIDSLPAFIGKYKNHLQKYIKNLLNDLSTRQFEEDPLLSLSSICCRAANKDITCGGAKYTNIGLTSVGMGSVVNSILNIRRLVFEEKVYTVSELNNVRKNNFDCHEDVLSQLKVGRYFYGCDDKYVLELVEDIMEFTEREFSKYTTFHNGCFKFGLSSPAYIDVAKNTPATLDGRKNGDPFSTHISSDRPLPVTELLSFASKLDYSGLKCNGNVVDFFVNPDLLKNNIDKYCLLVKSAFAQGVFQMQMNVVSSKTLIAARENPEQFPDLIVRVWGFSAYFKDLPDEYKDVLIQRAIESEKVA